MISVFQMPAYKEECGRPRSFKTPVEKRSRTCWAQVRRIGARRRGAGSPSDQCLGVPGRSTIKASMVGALRQ
jgi:hypothetical protein